jgi:hypothetical protein
MEVIKKPTEKEYRALPIDSSSSLKDFCVDRKKYYRKYILNEKIKEKDNQAANTGQLVETLLMEPELFDERFFMSSCASPPTGLMLEYVNALFEETVKYTDADGEPTKSFEYISEEAYKASGFKIPHTTVLNKFVGGDAEIYYNELTTVRLNNLTVVSVNDVSNAERVVEELKMNFVTADLINLETNDRFTVLNQLQIPFYEIDDHTFKSMLDKVVVDHKEKHIKIIDLKCTWSVESFYEEYYLYRRTYIQAYLYKQAVISLTKDKKHPFYGYSVGNPVFLVCDSINYSNPLIFTLSDDDMNDAYNGFSHKGKDYKGVKDLILGLKWALNEGIWNMSREDYLNKGVINIKRA